MFVNFSLFSAKYICISFQTISGQCVGNALNGLRPGLNGNGMAASILAGNSMLANGIAKGGLGLNGVAPNGLVANGLGANGLGLANAGCGGVASTGGGLAVQSSSAIAPTGLSVVSENAYEGGLTVGGNLPLLGTVALEGAMPSGGGGAVSYGCGDGAVGIATEGPIATGIVSPGTYGPGVAGIGAGALNGVAGAGLNGVAGGFGRIGYGAGNCL